MKKEKIGFFGGCFNPPTNTHINLANNLIKDGTLDKVIFVPVGDYYKKQNLTLATHRYNMLKLACKNNKDLSVEDIAINHKETLYASDTFKLIQNKYEDKDIEIYFIMGSDNFKKMPDWKDYEEIIEKYKFIVIERLSYKELSTLENVTYYKTNPTEDISSTQIRNKLKNEEDVGKWVDKEVLEYIRKNGLYN